jgi:hypothetical protein
MASSNDFARLAADFRSGQQPVSNWVARLIKAAKEEQAKPPLQFALPDGKRLLETSRQTVRSAYLLGFVYRMTGDASCKDRLLQTLGEVTRFPNWNPSHFLDVAEMTHAVAVSYDWLYDAWSDEERTMIRRAIVDMGLRPGDDACRTGVWWTRATHNWNQVCNGGLLSAALAIGDEDPELGFRVFTNALSRLPRAMFEFEPDGALIEGPGYWKYAMKYSIVAIASLQTALGQDFGLSSGPGFSKAGDFWMQVHGPTGRSFNFADSPDRKGSCPHMFWLGREFGRPEWLACEKLAFTAPAPEHVLWYDPDLDRTPAVSQPVVAAFRGVEMVSLRTAWDDPEAGFVALKGGTNGANHGHLDLGTFVYEALGERWVVDLPHDDYNLPDFFGKKRWTYYSNRAEGHNTLVLNPTNAPDQVLTARAPVLESEDTRKGPVASLDLSEAYAPHASSVRRRAELMRDGTFVLEDTFEGLTRDHDLWWFAHTPAEVVVGPDGRTARLSLNGKTVQVAVELPQDAVWSVMPARPLPTSPDPEKQNRYELFRKLAVHVRGTQPTNVIGELQAALGDLREAVGESKRSIKVRFTPVRTDRPPASSPVE